MKTHGDRTMNKTVFYVSDPMCSWCWGFSPEAQKMHNALQGRADLHIVVGGLRAGAREPMDDSLKAYAREHWEHVHERTGQPFDFTFFDRDGFVYDTESPCRAVVTMRSLAPEKTLDMLIALHREFYANNRDITDTDIVAEIAVEQGAEQGIDEDTFKAAYLSDEMRNATREDFMLSRGLGVSGFPTIVCRSGNQYGYLARGCTPFAILSPVLERWLESAPEGE
jgi:putative protein-disulfide isomerase